MRNTNIRFLRGTLDTNKTVIYGRRINDIRSWIDRNKEEERLIRSMLLKTIDELQNVKTCQFTGWKNTNVDLEIEHLRVYGC